jgi:transcriptional regulator
MYIPAHFREPRVDVLHRLVREHSFGTLVSRLEGELIATHLPFLLDEQRGPHGTLRAHMARANPHWRAFDAEAESMAIFQGPHAYISPSWYVSELNVPTWNYTAVHAYGRPTILEDPARVRQLLEATIAKFEAPFSEPWSMAGLPEEYVSNLARAIVAFEIPITRLDGKRKLGQNRTLQDMESAADGLRRQADATGIAVAQAMSEAAATRRSAP